MKKGLSVAVALVLIFTFYFSYISQSVSPVENVIAKAYDVKNGIHSKELNLKTIETTQMVNSIEMDNISTGSSSWAKIFGGVGADQAFSVL